MSVNCKSIPAKQGIKNRHHSPKKPRFLSEDCLAVDWVKDQEEYRELLYRISAAKGGLL